MGQGGDSWGPRLLRLSHGRYSRHDSGVGFVDDLGALTAALGMVAVHVKHEHTQQSSEKLREWFGNEGNGEPEET